MDSAFSAAGALLLSFGGGAVIVVGLSSWLGKLWATRIIEAERTSAARESSDRTRRIESLMRHYERQVEEFYGPLFNMVNQIFVANEIKWTLLDGPGRTVTDSRAREAIAQYFHATYFIPLHDEVIKIMRSKLYLIDGGEIPESFHLYMKHASQERDQRSLWKDFQIDTSFLKGQPWPPRFYEEIKAGFELSMRNYERCLNGIKEIKGFGASSGRGAD